MTDRFHLPVDLALGAFVGLRLLTSIVVSGDEIAKLHGGGLPEQPEGHFFLVCSKIENCIS